MQMRVVDHRVLRPRPGFRIPGALPGPRNKTLRPSQSFSGRRSAMSAYPACDDDGGPIGTVRIPRPPGGDGVALASASTEG